MIPPKTEWARRKIDMTTDEEILRKQLGFASLKNSHGIHIYEDVLVCMAKARQDEREQNGRKVSCSKHGAICVPDLRPESELHLYFCPVCATENNVEESIASERKRILNIMIDIHEKMDCSCSSVDCPLQIKIKELVGEK